MKFTWLPGKSASTAFNEDDIVNIHLSSDNYAPDLMLRDEGALSFSTIRMIPPGHLKYYFTVNGNQKLDATKPSKNISMEVLDSPLL